MSGQQKFVTAFSVLAIVVATVVFVTSDSDTPGPATTPNVSEVGGSGPTDSVPESRVIRIREGSVVGAAPTIFAGRGDQISFVVDSDSSDSVHLHGYDIERPVAAGKPARFKLRATIEGTFTVELERAGLEIATVSVTPTGETQLRLR